MYEENVISEDICMTTLMPNTRSGNSSKHIILTKLNWMQDKTIVIPRQMAITADAISHTSYS